MLILNVLNVDIIERELGHMAARSIHPSTKSWLLTVARKHLLNLEGNEQKSEFQLYAPPKKNSIHTEMPDKAKLPDWAKKAAASKAAIHVFDAVQPCKRPIWQTLEAIVDWFNAMKKDDPIHNRISRVSFEQAREQALAWRKDINENPWSYIKDRPNVHHAFDDGVKWVRLTNVLHLNREGTMMKHCVYGSQYISQMQSGGAEFYSLRDPENNPHITVQVLVEGDMRKIQQMKGKTNQKPGPRWQPYLRWLADQPKWKVVGDISYLDEKEKTAKQSGKAAKGGDKNLETSTE